MSTIESLITEVEQYHPQADTALIRRAYEVAAEAHKEQKRKSGIPYITHPLEVAHILTGLHMDTTTLASALLHDTIEDTSVTEEQVAAEFGREIADLVVGVTKLSKLEFYSKEERQAESFRKMVVAMAKDLRVILVKLADRLHNLRTLDAMVAHKQRAIAQETMDIYAPLAHRMGVTWMKAELEDLSFCYLHPRAYQEIASQLAGKEEFHQKYLARIQELIAKELGQMQIPCRITGRPKHYYSIYQKMQRQKIDFEEVHDLLAIRIITDTMRSCYAILGIIHSLWKPIPGRFKDYIALPKPNGYQSLHTTVAGPDGERFELQIRTEAMHRIAEEGIAAHWHYKEHGSTQTSDMHFAWLRRLMEWQQDVKDPIEFLETVKVDMFPEEVYVFTPMGDVRSFPRGATPVDFAYAVHTDIGNQCTGARINGRMVPLRYQLRNGDTVEILTSPNHVPSRDWLRWVVTPRARNKIKSWLKAEDKERSLALGRDLCEREAQKYVSQPHAYCKPDMLLEVAPGFGYQTAEELLAAVGYGRVSALQVVHRLLPPEVVEARKQAGKSPTIPYKAPQEQSVKVYGLDDILVTFARCCNPLPGESVVGYVTRGRGVAVHTSDCPSVAKLDYDAERRVPVTWDIRQNLTHSARILVETHDQQGVLANVSAAISACHVNISRSTTTTTPDKKAHLEFTIEIRDIEQLNDIMTRLSSLRGVVSVERLKNTRRLPWRS